MKHQIPEAFKEHMKHKKDDMPMDDGKTKKEPEKTGRAAKEFMRGHGRKANERGCK